MMKQLWLGIIFLMHGALAYGATELYHVAPSGGAWPCGATDNACDKISTVTSNTLANDVTIRLATGSYLDSAFISSGTSNIAVLNISGGWNADFSSEECKPALTTLDSPAFSSSIKVSALAASVIEVDLTCIRIKGVLTSNHTGLSLNAYGGSLIFKAQQIVFEDIAGTALGLYSDSSGSISIGLQKTIFRNGYQSESNKWSGGAISASAWAGSTQTINLDNSLLYNNAAIKGAAINVVAHGTASTIELSILNSTISGNHSIGPDDGGGVYVVAEGTSQTTVHLKNSIIWGNDYVGVARDIFLRDFASSVATVNASYSDVGEVHRPSSTGVYNDNGNNLDVDPQLNNRYRLSDTSPVIDRAQCGYISLADGYTRVAPYDDIDGDSRPGDGNLSGCDIGADETPASFCMPLKTSAGKVAVFCL